jgi:hypothetical protein
MAVILRPPRCWARKAAAYPPTHLLGEHGGGQGPTTTAPLIEETTQIAGEGQPQISTFPPAEEQSTFAYRRSEAVLMDPKGWQTGRAEATTLAIGEETTQIAGEGQPPHITTELQAEEQGGGGTVFTTLVVGEEGGYGGTTAPLIEETTQVAGEGWHDPQNQNPLGRR